MKTLVVNRGYGIMVDSENLDTEIVNTERNSLDDVFLIKEPCHIKALFREFNSDKTITQELDAQPGDILVKFYENYFPNHYVLIKSAEWKENIEAYNKQKQKEKEDWAANKGKVSTLSEPKCETIN